MNRFSKAAAALLLITTVASAEIVRGAPIRASSLYLSPDIASTKLSEIDRGREVIILETIPNWVHVEANLTEEKTITGWLPVQIRSDSFNAKWRQDSLR